MWENTLRTAIFASWRVCTKIGLGLAQAMTQANASNKNQFILLIKFVCSDEPQRNNDSNSKSGDPDYKTLKQLIGKMVSEFQAFDDENSSRTFIEINKIFSSLGLETQQKEGEGPTKSEIKTLIEKSRNVYIDAWYLKDGTSLERPEEINKLEFFTLQIAQLDSQMPNKPKKPVETERNQTPDGKNRRASKCSDYCHIF